MKYLFTLTFAFSILFGQPPKVQVGCDQLFSNPYIKILKNKKVGLITNQTAINYQIQSTADLLKANEKIHHFTLTTLFAPEHGLFGDHYSEKIIHNTKHYLGIPILSLYGDNAPKKISNEMLEKIDILIYDIQDIGSRSYTYSTTLFYAMESAAKTKTHIMVLDRPNPINGITIDGPLLDPKWRSQVSYINVPYCHGMTIGELAKFFKGEYKIDCKLTVVPMKGWKREMSFSDTGLTWIPTSPQIPEASTALYYPTTGILGELQIVNIGIGYTLPFKVIGAPWIDSENFATQLNKLNFPGVTFKPYRYRPFFGRFAKELCHGVLIIITDPKTYKPVSTQYLLIGILKSLYPKQFQEALDASKKRKEMFCKINGTEEVYQLVSNVKHIVYQLKGLHQKERELFEVVRKKYLIPDYEPTLPKS